MTTVRAEIARYLSTGQYDPIFSAWDGSVLERCKRGSQALTDALVAEVKRRTRGIRLPVCQPVADLAGFTCARVEPMVVGLFPARERPPVLRLLEQSVVFVTPENVESVLRAEEWPCTAWDVANLYLGSVGARTLGDDKAVVGLAAERTCYVSFRFFEEPDPLADFVVHEAAHIFQHCKRVRIGLPATRRREWLLEIAFQKRETFAYCCEALSRLLVLGKNRGERERLWTEHGGALPSGVPVDPDEYRDILREAIGARNGWKRILARCAPSPART